MPKEVPNEVMHLHVRFMCRVVGVGADANVASRGQVRHLLVGADWSSPRVKARTAKNLEQIIHLVDTFPVCSNLRSIATRSILRSITPPPKGDWIGLI